PTACRCIPRNETRAAARTPPPVRPLSLIGESHFPRARVHFWETGMIDTSRSSKTIPVASRNRQDRALGRQAVSLVHPFAFLAVSVRIFAGALSALTGVAFSAVVGAVLLHVLTPCDAVPLMMACRMITQLFSLV